MPRNAAMLAASACLNGLTKDNITLHNVGLHVAPGSCTIKAGVPNKSDGVMDCTPGAAAADPDNAVPPHDQIASSRVYPHRRHFQTRCTRRMVSVLTPTPIAHTRSV